MQPLLAPPNEPLAQWLAEQGLPSYRLRQVHRWLFHQRVDSFEAMTDLPAGLRQKIAETFCISSSREAQHQQAPDGTHKLLLSLSDGQHVECVLLRNDRGHRTACISTQVGCGMGCVFCASGLSGLVRNLASGEILEQLLHLSRLLPAEERLTHIVVMGMGEPLANLDALLPSLAVATNQDGLGISARRITISTVGFPAGIGRLSQLEPPYHLAISLHAPTDALRNRLVPANRAVGVASLVEAADEFFARTGRRVTYEYALLSGENDQPEHASQLGRLLQGRPVLVNLIALNPVADLPFRGSAAGVVSQFKDVLERFGVPVQIRRRKGECIDAACGQLRRRAETGIAGSGGPNS